MSSSGITHTSKQFHTDFHAINGVFNLRQDQTDSMYYFYKVFDSNLATCKLTGCDATIFTGLGKHDDDAKDVGQHMS